MGEFFGNVQLPDWNQLNIALSPDRVGLLHNQMLASAYAPQAADLANQTQQQNLDDRGALRVLAPQLASADPNIRMNALTSAAVLPAAGGVDTTNALSTDAARTAQTKLQLYQFGNSLPQLPYGGGPTNPLAPAAQGSTSVPGGFTQQLGQAESGGNPASVNKQGYSGSLQFGTGRLTDLGLYQPAQGENPNGNTWQGTITVPGFAPMTHQQFLNSPDAQRMANEVHVKDLQQAVANTPGAQGYNPAGLMAVAHLGGVAGMQKFVATGGQYNPHDANGTSLQNYYDKFSQGGPPALQQQFGHPDGPLADDHPARVQVASAANPAVASDVAPVDAPGPAAAPGSTTADNPDALQAKIAAMRAGGNAGPAAPMADQGVSPTAPAAPPPFDPMAGLPAGSKPITVGPAGSPYTQGAPAGYGIAQAPDGSTHFYPLVQPALKYEKTPTEIVGMDPRTGAVVSRQPLQTELKYEHTPTELLGLNPITGAVVSRQPIQTELKYEKTPTEIIGMNPRTGAVVSRQPITETGRQQLVPTPDGNQVWINGHPTGQTIPYSGRPEQNEAYKADQRTAAGISASGLAAQSIMPRLNEMAQIGGGLQTGVGGEFRAKTQAVLEQLGASPADAARITGISSAAAADEYRKLAISTAGTAAKADLGANNGVEAMRIYQSANPSLTLQPDANKRITNMLRVQQQSVQDYAQAASQHFGDNETKFLGGGNYAPLTAFNRAWQAQANPQVYAAATGILNGDPYAKWADKLGSPADAVRAAGIAARIDPNVMVPVAGGKMRPARELIGAQ